VFTLSAALAVTLVVTAMLVSRYAAPRGTPASLIAATTLLVTAIAFGLRAFVSLTGEASQVSLASQSAPQVAILLIGALFVAGSTLGFIAMAQDRQRQQALELARRDGLTGLYTRTAFLEKVEAVSQSARPRRYAVVMADIDHFKGINDTFGHAGGDAVLAHAARMLVGAARSSDVVGRYGGEEFCIVLWDCDAVQVAEYELRIVMEAQRQSVRLPGGRTANYTLSVGHACWSDAGADAAQAFPDVIERADQALCLVKRSGRNQAVAASRVALALVEP
jgi:diguanylate cyclase (GGDEF)-like protein